LPNLPTLLVQKNPSQNAGDNAAVAEIEIIAIAVYDKGVEVPLPVSMQRVFAGDRQFKFPSEITTGVAKTRVVYRYTLQQWRELLASLASPCAPAGLKQLMIPMLLYLKKEFPNFFQDVAYDEEFDEELYAEVVIGAGC